MTNSMSKCSLVTAVTSVTTFLVMSPSEVMRKNRRDRAGVVGETSHNSRRGHVSISGDSGDTGDGETKNSGEEQHLNPSRPARRDASRALHLELAAHAVGGGLDALGACEGVEARLWRPSDWPEIEQRILARRDGPTGRGPRPPPGRDGYVVDR